MIFAIECFGGVRCGIKHNHIQHFIDTFPEIFNDNNEIHIFLLSTKQDWHGAVGADDDTIQTLKDLLGDKLKIIEFYEDLQEDVKKIEDKYYNEWQTIDNKFKLTDKELIDYKQDVIKGIILRKKHNLYIPSLIEALDYVNHKMATDKTIAFITQQGNTFVRRLYYRRMLVNSLRKKYQEENNIKYDWVVMCRLFDVNFEKLKPLSFFSKLPLKDTTYAAVDHFVASAPEIIDNIYETLGHKYPVINWEQWHNERYKKEYIKFDIGIYFLRHAAGWCSEHQLFWQILQSSKNFVNLRAGCNFKEHITDPNGYFISEFCHNRFS